MPFPSLANTGYQDPAPLVANTLAELRLLVGPTASPGFPAGQPPLNVAVQTDSGSVWPPQNIGPYPRCRLLGATAAFDQAAKEYTWDASSTAADNGTTIIQPFNGTSQALATGRWRYV